MAPSEAPVPAPGPAAWSIRDRAGTVVEKDEMWRTAVPPSAAQEPPASSPATVPAPAPAGPSRWWVWPTVGLVGLLLLGTGIGVASFLGDEEDGAVTCADGQGKHPYENSCLEDRDSCYAWMKAPQRYTPLSCPVYSADGRLHIDVDFKGSGTVIVAVDDPEGKNVFYRTWGGDPKKQYVVDDTLNDLRGKRGEWTLRVTFVEAAGTAEVRLWG